MLPNESNGPSLLDLSANCVIENASSLLVNNAKELGQLEVESILNQSKKFHRVPQLNFFDHFTNGERYPTSIMPICSNFVSDETFAKILIGQEKNLLEVDLTGNKSIGSKLLLDYLLEFKDNLPELKSLFVSNQWMLSMYRDCMDFEASNSSVLMPTRTSSQNLFGDVMDVISFTQFFPSITHFRNTLIDDYSLQEKRSDFMTRILQPLRNLEILELNRWTKLLPMNFLASLSNSLTTLRLYDCPDVKNGGIEQIMKLKNLEFLDISQTMPANGMFMKPASTLYKLVSSLPKLKKLDIANTNLCLPFGDEDERVEERMKLVVTDVHGLTALHSNLDFLSVFHCDHVNPSTKLPALQIASELTEEQLIVALRVYMDRDQILESVLNELFQIYRLGNEETNSDYTEGLHLILDALSIHRHVRTLQTSGTAALFYAIRHTSNSMSLTLKRRVVEVILDILDNYNDEAIIVRNSCLSFCQLEIPKDVVFAYSRMVIVLVRILNTHSGDSTTPRAVIYLLNSMACQTGHDSKLEVGISGAIQSIITHIHRRIERQVVDETVEVGWSFLWNITDETPANCDLFLKSDGITLFWRCYTEWPDRKDLVRNMLGLIGNIAEVEHLRTYLMHDNLIKIFSDLLDVEESDREGIETSYNSAGVLAQLLTDQNWDNVTISRALITDRVIKTTCKWQLNCKRYINYRSFGPILRLLPFFSSPGSQVWALFAIANLTSTDKEKYCEFVVRENGIPLIQNILNDVRSTQQMINFAKVILENVASQQTHSSSNQ